MEGFGVPAFENVRKKRSSTSRRPRPDSSTPPSDNVGKVSSDENGAGDTSSRRKEINLNHFNSSVSSVNPSEGDNTYKKVRKHDGTFGDFDGSSSNGGSRSGNEQGRSGSDFKRCSEGVLAPVNWKSTNKVMESSQSQMKGPDNHTSSGVSVDGTGNDNKLRKVKLKVGGVTRTIHAKSPADCIVGGGSSMKSLSHSGDVPKARPKLILQENSDDDQYPAPVKASGLQGVPWKDFSRGGFGLVKEESSKNRMAEETAYWKHVEKSESVRKSKRVPKRRHLDEAFDDEEDEEIRYLEKLKTSNFIADAPAAYEEDDDEGSRKHRKISKVSRVRMGDDDFKEDLEYGSSRSNRDAKRKPRAERATEDTEYVAEELASDDDPDVKRKKQKDSDTLVEGKREFSLTTRQRALQGKETSTGASFIEFPNGLPPAPPRKQKEKLSEVEQQLKKAEAAQRRRMQVEKANRESEAEAIRKILGQDSSRKKREDKERKRRDELAQEKAENARTLPPNTIRWVSGPNGTTVTFSEEQGYPSIFDKKPHSYPEPPKICAGPSCTNPSKYRDSTLDVRLCSLKCYKAVRGQT